jgi:hypothetical protein
MTYVSGDAARAERVLHPFRHTLTPITDQSATLDNMFEVSHVADENLREMPRRMNMQAAVVSDIRTDTALEVWDQWRQFTENEDGKESIILWEIDRPEKILGAGKVDSAVHPRDPHYCVVIYGR